MKLWDSLTTCLILLSAVHGGPLQHRAARGRGRAADGSSQLPPVRISLSVTSPGSGGADPAGGEETLAAGEQYTMEEILPSEFEDVVDFIKVTISRIRRSPSSTSPSSSSSVEKLGTRTRNRREKKKKKGANKERKGGRGRPGGGETGRKTRRGGRGGGGRGHGCTLRQLHLNVTDLGLGYRSGEEMIFRYCSGPCRKSETNYDKILFNLVHNRKLALKDTPPPACCRPIAFDDDLSFLDDSLIYHTVRRHSARKCGCV